MGAFVLRDITTDRERSVFARSLLEAASLADDNEEVVA
jgi:hypothetical protein